MGKVNQVLISTGLMLAALGSRAFADPPDFMMVDQFGVDQLSGNLSVWKSYISVGPANGEQLKYFWNFSYFSTFSGATAQSIPQDNYTYYLTGSSTGTGSVGVVLSDVSKTFNCTSYVCTPNAADGSSLTYSGSIYTYTGADGAVVTFNGNPAYVRPLPYNQAIAFATKIVKPNGYTINISFVFDHFTHSQTTYYIIRLASVNDSNGYQLKFVYKGTTPAYTGWSDSAHPYQVIGINNAIDYCATVAPCGAFTQSWPTATFNFGDTTTAADPIGNTTTFNYGGTSGFLQSITKPGHSTPDISYNPTSTGFNVVFAGQAWNYNISLASPKMITITSPLGSVKKIINYVSSTFARPASISNTLNNTTIYDYYSNGAIKAITYPKGNSAQFVYDGRGNLTQTTNISKTPGSLVNIVTSAAYPASCTNVLTCNEPTSSTDDRGNTTSFTYDPSSGQIATVTAPPVNGISAQRRYTYTPLQAYYKNSAGSIVASGQSVYLLTQASSCQTSTSCLGTADETRTTIDYGPQTAGTLNNLLPASQTVAAGDGSLTATTSYGYDTIANIATVTDPNGNISYAFHDANQQVLGAISADPDGGGSLSRRAVRFTYGPDNQVTKVAQGTAGGTSLSDLTSMITLRHNDVAYDSAGRKIQDSLTAGSTLYSVTQYSYDAASRLDCTATRMNPSVFSSLPSSACMLGTTGSLGADRIVKNGYNTVDQLTSATTGYGTASVRTEQAYSYTENGKVASVADANNNVTSYQYDGLDRLTTTYYPSPTTAGSSSTTDYEQISYVSGSNKASSKRLRDGQAITYGYDALNRLISKSYSSGDPTLSYTYDLFNRPAMVARGTLAVTYSYDALSRETSESQPFGSASSRYDAAGRRTRLTWSDGYYVTYDYDNVNEMIAIRENGAASGAGVLATFSYDDLGRRVSLGRGNVTTTSYSYDYSYADRFACILHDLAGGSAAPTCGATPTASGQDFAVNYGYNAASQITTRASANDSYAWTQSYNVNRNYATNGLNQYTATGSITPTYDARGNLTSAGGTTYSYSSENLLFSATGATASTLQYDGLGRLAEYDSSVLTRFFYDGPNLIAEVDNPSGNILRRYVHGPGDDEPLVWYEGSGTSDRRWLHADERGSIVAITNGAGNALNINSYDAWGIPQTGNLGRFQYTGQTWLPEIGLYYYKARIYSATLGRFIQTDPIGYADGFNWYNYVHSDPINGTDPSGLIDASIYDTQTIEVIGRSDTTVIANRDFPLAVSGGGSALPRQNGGDRVELLDKLAKQQPQPQPQPQPQNNPCNQGLVGAGNALADLSNASGTAANALTLGGLAGVGLGVVTLQPEVAGAGLAAIATGGVFGLVSGASQVASGVLQGVGGAGYSNAVNGGVSLAGGFAFGGLTGARVPSGYRTVSQRAGDNGARNMSMIAGGMFSAVTAAVPNLGAERKTCPR